VVKDSFLATQLVSTFVWQSYVGHRSETREGTSQKAKRLKAPMTYIVRHGRGYPRHDLLIFDPNIPPGKIEQGFVDISEDDLRSGWRQFRDIHSITSTSAPRWLASLSIQDVPEIAHEGMAAQRHFFIAMHPPRIVWTSGLGLNLPLIASTALPISKSVKGSSIATACKSCSGPLSGVTPGNGEEVSFHGATSGHIITYVIGWTPELPWFVPGCQSRILTPAVTNGGDFWKYHWVITSGSATSVFMAASAGATLRSCH
jgi:hypothetical protein